jgi:hypothetical protein
VHKPEMKMIRIEKTLLEKLRVEAATSRRDMTAQLNHILSRHYSRHPQPGPALPASPALVERDELKELTVLLGDEDA